MWWHPRFVASNGRKTWAAEIGRFGAWGDVTRTTRWGSGACGNFELSFTLPLPADFEHPMLKRGVRVELMGGAFRLGSSFVISQVARGSLDQPWTITAEGAGRLVEGRSSFYAFDASETSTTTPSVAVDEAISRGLPWAGRDATVPTTAHGTPEEPVPLGTLLTDVGDQYGTFWGVWDDDKVGYRVAATSPKWQVTPQTVTLGSADDQYASVVYLRYVDSTSGLSTTVSSPASQPAVESTFERQEVLYNWTDKPAMSAAEAQALADGIYEKAKGRLAFVDRMTLTANQLQTIGGNRGNLAMVEAGDMVRLNGVSSELLEFNGLTYLDFVIGEAKYTKGAQTIEVSPAGLAARDLASIAEDIAGAAFAA